MQLRSPYYITNFKYPRTLWNITKEQEIIKTISTILDLLIILENNLVIFEKSMSFNTLEVSLSEINKNLITNEKPTRLLMVSKMLLKQ